LAEFSKWPHRSYDDSCEGAATTESARMLLAAAPDVRGNESREMSSARMALGIVLRRPRKSFHQSCRHQVPRKAASLGRHEGWKAARPLREPICAMNDRGDREDVETFPASRRKVVVESQAGAS
jgi:hypothetical protein